MTDTSPPWSIDTVLLDVDGTLVDSSYQHSIAWYRAFREHGRTLPVWLIHRHIGMGGDQLVPTVAGEDFERQHGDDVRAAWEREYGGLIDEVVAFDGATELLRDIKERGLRLVLASSGKPQQVERYVDQLRAREFADGWTTSEDVSTTKPAPDLLRVAMQKLGGEAPLAIGDSTWDCVAARRIGAPCLALRTGGVSADELVGAGAAEVFDSLPRLRTALDRLLR